GSAMRWIRRWSGPKTIWRPSTSAWICRAGGGYRIARSPIRPGWRVGSSCLPTDADARARPACLPGECPPAYACGEGLLLYFAPKACRSRLCWWICASTTTGTSSTRKPVVFYSEDGKNANKKPGGLRFRVRGSRRGEGAAGLLQPDYLALDALVALLANDSA